MHGGPFTMEGVLDGVVRRRVVVDAAVEIDGGYASGDWGWGWGG